MRIERDEEEGWNKHFEMLMSKSRNHSVQAGETQSNTPLNRYLNVKPYDKSRVKLQRADTDYINANLVTVPKAARQYILTQGPLPETLGHFWLMVWEQKSNVIVMLNRLIEREEFPKCEQYWPSSVGKSVHYDDVNLTITLKSIDDIKHYTVREILLKDDETDKSRTITQFHYTAWPDHGEPDSPTSFLRLLTAIRKSGGLDRMDEPLIVHCSAGIGRSGTFCLIDSILTMVENQGSTEGIDIVSTLLEMRDYRMGLIQTPVQLRFSYMSIIYGIKILERANKLHPHISSIKDSRLIDNGKSQQQNGSAQNVKKQRRGKKKQNSLNSPLNIFKKDLLVEALDDIDSDSADSMFYNTMKPWPSIKKPKNSHPDEIFNASQSNKPDSIANGLNAVDGQQSNYLHDGLEQNSAAFRAQKLNDAINSMLTENTISTNIASSKLSSNSLATQNTDSVLLRRREKELKNQRLAERVMDTKKRMKEEDLKREQYARRISLVKKSAFLGGVTALIVSSLVYIYLQGNNSS